MAEAGSPAGAAALLGHAVGLAQALARTLRDMSGQEYHLDEGSKGVRRFRRAFPMQVSIGFTGPLEGEYVLSLRPETAARLAGGWTPDQDGEALAAFREPAEAFVKEALNAAVGEAIQALDRFAKGVRFLPASAAYGGAAADGPPCGQINLFGPAGPIACCFLLSASAPGAA